MWQNSFDSTPGKCNLKENWKGCNNRGKNKKAGVTFSCPRGKNWSIYLALLPSFLPSFPRCPSRFVLSALNSALPALSLAPYQTDPPSLHLSFFFLPPSPLLASPLLTANVCDEEMLLCQNGGTCYMNQKCVCSPEFKGVLCQQSRCEAGKDCNGASSPRLSAAALLLCTLSYLLATLSHHWATKRRPQSPASSYLPTLQTLGVCAHGRGTGTWGGGGHL